MNTDDFLPTASLDNLASRAEVLKRLRSFFDRKGFLEVETPILSHDTVVDQHIQPIGLLKKQVQHGGDEVLAVDDYLWLQTSPEFGMKRLLAAGACSIYQITKSFRAAERGRCHNPEFTMLEWYRVGDDMFTGMDLLAELVEEILVKGTTHRLTYRQVFEQQVGIDPHVGSTTELRQVCNKHGIATDSFLNENLSRDFWLNLILSHLIEPNLGTGSPTIVYDWPASQSALAIVREEETPVAERFELYVDGLEIANGYHELLDPNVLTKRNQDVNRLRQGEGNPTLPEESRLLAAMRHGLPACAGVALGVDRLVMLATGARSIDEIISFPFERA